MLKENVSRTGVKFVIENVGEAKGDLIRFLAPRTIETLLRAMPINGITALTKGMVYFEIPVKVGVEKPKTQAETGTIAYWPISSALCIFFEKSSTYSPVNIVGKITDNLELFRRIGSGKRIRIAKIL